MKESLTLTQSEEFAQVEKEAYEKTLLYVYPHLKKMATIIQKNICNAAIASYFSQEAVEIYVQRLLCCERQSYFLLHIKRELSLILKDFSLRELYVLEQRYFRRKKFLREYKNNHLFKNFPMRSFYRYQHTVLKKFEKALRLRNMDEQWFKDNFSDIDCVMTVYKKVLLKDTRELIFKKKSNASPTRRKLLKKDCNEVYDFTLTHGDSAIQNHRSQLPW